MIGTPCGAVTLPRFDRVTTRVVRGTLVARIAVVLRDRQEVATRKMSAEELSTGVSRSRCADDDMQTREMPALERDELLGVEAQQRPANRRPRPRRPTMRTQRLRIAMIALARPALPRSVAGRIAATVASVAIAAVVLELVFR